MASVRPNAGSTGDLLRLRVMDPMDMESGGGVNPTLARSFPAKKGGASVRASAILARLLLSLCVALCLVILAIHCKAQGMWGFCDASSCCISQLNLSKYRLPSCHHHSRSVIHLKT